MSKIKKFLDNWVMYLALTVLAILAIPIMLVILCGIAHDFGIGILLAWLAGVIGGIWLVKFSFEKIFHLYIRSWFSFSLWLFLTILICFLLYSLCNGDLSFKEMLSWGGRRVPSSGGGVLVLPIAWIIMFGLAFQKSPTGRPAKNALQAQQNEIDELYEQAFEKKDFNALCELVNTFVEGENQKFFKNSPVQAAKVFEGAQRLVQLVEAGQEKQPELEDYYWLGLMYETGFACPPNPARAEECYIKALATKTCWDGDPKNFHRQSQQIKQRLVRLQNLTAH